MRLRRKTLHSSLFHWFNVQLYYVRFIHIAFHREDNKEKFSSNEANNTILAFSVLGFLPWWSFAILLSFLPSSFSPPLPPSFLSSVSLSPHFFYLSHFFLFILVPAILYFLTVLLNLSNSLSFLLYPIFSSYITASSESEHADRHNSFMLGCLYPTGPWNDWFGIRSRIRIRSKN